MKLFVMDLERFKMKSLLKRLWLVKKTDEIINYNIKLVSEENF